MGCIVLNNHNKDDIDAHIGACIKKRRLEIKISQKELGVAINVTFQQIQKYEKGVNRILASKLLNISEALGVSITYFFPKVEVVAESDINTAVNTYSQGLYREAENLMNEEGFAFEHESVGGKQNPIASINKIKDPIVKRNLVNLINSISEKL